MATPLPHDALQVDLIRGGGRARGRVPGNLLPNGASPIEGTRGQEPAEFRMRPGDLPNGAGVALPSRLDAPFAGALVDGPNPDGVIRGTRGQVAAEPVEGHVVDQIFVVGRQSAAHELMAVVVRSRRRPGHLVVDLLVLVVA